MTQDEALKLALEALKSCSGVPHWPALQPAIASLRQAIREHAMYKVQRLGQEIEQEPVAWITLQKEAQQIVESKVLWKKFIDGTPLANDIACWMADFVQQYTCPPQRTWVGIDEAEIIGLTCECIDEGEFNIDCAIDFAKAIEAKLKELNA